MPGRRPPGRPGPAGADAGADRRAHPRVRPRAAHRQGGRGAAARGRGALPAGRTPRLPALRRDHHPGLRVAGADAAAGQAGHALRRVPRSPAADLREDHLGHGAGRALLRRHVPGGGRPRRHQARGQGTDPGRRGLRQGDDDRRPLQRARGPRAAPAHRAGAGRRHRRGAPAGLPGGRARRGPGRLRGGDQARRGHHRARHVPAPAAGPAGGDGRRWPGPGAHAVGLLLDGRPGGGGRPRGPTGASGEPAGGRRRRTPIPGCRRC